MTVIATLMAGCGVGFGLGQAATTGQSTAPVGGQVGLPATPAATSGGTIRGSVKAGAVPLPGVAVTATNTLTGKKYATTTDVNGAYEMAIPRNGRYVVKAELAAFASETKEVLVNAASENGGLPVQTAEFGLQLASRVAAAGATETAGTRSGGASALRRGVQSLTMAEGDAETVDASTGTQNAGAALPSLASLGGSDAAATDSVAVSGVQGTTTGMASFSEDEIRSRIQDAIAQNRGQGGGDPTNAILGALGGMMGGGGFGPGGGGPGGGRGGRGGGGGGFGSGAFRNFNPAQPHGSIFYQGGNSALNSAPWSPTLLPETNPSAYSNRFGASIAGSPYIPGLTKPDTRQFVFINLTGQKNLNAFLPNPVRVPTLLERAGDFSQSAQTINGVVTPVTLYDPATGLPIPGNNLAHATTPISAQALALLNFYPAPNIVTSDPTAYNYQTISNAGSNNVAINSRYQRQLGKNTGTPFGRFGGGGGGGRRGGEFERSAGAAAEHQCGLQLLAFGERPEKYLSAAGGRDPERRELAEPGIRGELWAALEQCFGELEPQSRGDAELLYG